MTDRTRDAFEAWFPSKDFGPNGLRQIDGDYVHAPAATYWRVWQAATAVERERCALVCRREADIQKSSASFCGIDNLDQSDFDICEAAIRQGGEA